MSRRERVHRAAHTHERNSDSVLKLLLIAALCVVWGSTFVVIKIGLTGSPPFYGVAFRFLLAVAMLGAIVAATRRRLPVGKTHWNWIVLSGLLMYFVSYAIVYHVEQYIDAALAAILFASFPFFVAVGAHFHLPGERLTMPKTLGLIIGFAGVLVIFSGEVNAPGREAWWAPGVMLLAPLASAAATIIVKKHLTRQNPVTLTCMQVAVGVAVLLPMALLTEDITAFQWTAVTVGAVVYLALLGTVFTFVTYFYLLRTMAASKLALIAFATPITAAAIGWIALGEVLQPSTIFGALLVLVGIWLVSIVRGRGNAAAQ